MTPVPVPSPEPQPTAEVLSLRAEVAVLKQFKARIEAEYAEPGAITKAEVKDALGAVDNALKVLGK